MRKPKYLGFLALLFVGLPLAQNRELLQPATFALHCAGGDCLVLNGAPQTAGVRSGSVSLKPGESVGWHSTSGNEEVLVILSGDGVAQIADHPDMPLHERMMAYIPPSTRHNVANNGTRTLEYVWIVASVKSHRDERSENGSLVNQPVLREAREAER